VVSTERARKMVREWGMSERIGPMAWGSQGQVFLGEDLMHTRDYSDDTARVIDEEVESVLRQAEERCNTLLLEHRKGLDLVARALLEYETIDGSEVTRLIQLAAGAGAPAITNRGSSLNLGTASIPDRPDLSGLPATESTFDPTQSFPPSQFEG
jgi:cell division protease FtsH